MEAFEITSYNRTIKSTGSPFSASCAALGMLQEARHGI
jgi:hypothetical protein